MKQLILASGSPRRLQILKEHGIEPRIIKPDVTETCSLDLSMEQAVMYLALKKALYVEGFLTDRMDSGLIIAADTVVYKDRIIGKPKDGADAKAILQHLRAAEHCVATGVAVLDSSTKRRCIFCEVTNVFFKDYTDRTIDEYIATDEVWDKAGSYAIQGGFAPYVERIEGDYDNVVGFPWTRICAELKRVGIELNEEFLEGN